MRLQKSEFIDYSKSLQKDYSIKFLSGINEKRLSPHFHECYEMLYFVEGKVAYQTKSGYFILRPGDIMFHDIYDTHSPLTLNQDTLYERITLQIKPEKLSALSLHGFDLAKCFKSNNSGIFRAPYYTQNSIRLILGKIIAVDQEKPFGYKLLIDAYLTELFVKISEFFCNISSSSNTEELQPLQLISIVDQYITENIDSPISVDALAQFVCMNKYSLMRNFKDLSGSTIYQYIINKRLEAAESMINSGISFSSAAEKCGFSDYSCFYRCFIKKNKMPPKMFFESRIS